MFTNWQKEECSRLYSQGMIEDMQARGNLGSIDHNLIRSEIAAKMNAKWGEGEQKDAGVRLVFLQRNSYMVIKIKLAEEWDWGNRKHQEL